MLTPETVKARLMKTAGKTFHLVNTATDPTTGQSFTSFVMHSPSEPKYIDVAAGKNTRKRS